MIDLTRRRLIVGGAIASLPWKLQAAPGERMSAFIVGINDYRSLKPLSRAVNDARDMAARMTGYGYDVTLALDATSDALLAAKGQFLTSLGASAKGVSFCYFACHGVQIGGTNFLLPADVDASSVDAMLEGAVQFDDVLKEIERTRPQQSIVVLDACRNDPAFAASAGQGFAAAGVPNDFYVVFSAGTGEYAVDNLGPEDVDRNGLFARSLLRHLSPSDSFDDVIKRVRGEVYQAARAIGRRQHPGLFNQIIGEPRLVPASRPTTAPAAPKLGRMASTAVLLVTGDRYPSSMLNSLVAPEVDVATLGSVFKTLGVEARVLRNPDSKALIAALEVLAAKDVDDVIVYYSGMGGMIDGDGFMFLPDTGTPQSPAASATLDGKPAQGISVLTIASLLGVLRANSRPIPAKGEVRGFALEKKGAAKAGPLPPELHKRVTLIMDTNLIDWGIKLTGRVPQSAINRLLDGSAFPGLDGVAILYSAGVYQMAIDQAEGSNRGPMAIALSNALTRPGLTLSQLVAVVRSEVEDITRGKQTPVFYATESMRKLVLVDEPV